MKTTTSIHTTVALGLAYLAVATGGSSLGAAEVTLNGHTFTLPDGFEIEQVAGPPLVDRPICADFDDQGRLYVADSSGSNENVKIQLEKRPHRIVRLEDADGDGRFDKSVVFADRMMFPEGTLWHQGSVYVGAPPVIWKLTDTDGDGVADQREEWFDGKTLTGCANDLHGPYAGPDGWIYWCKGAFADQTYERPGKPPFVTRAAHIFRRRPEGGPIEPVMTGGMDNPVEVVFTPGGERIFTTTFLTHPGGGLRDGLIHAIYGGVYGKVHGVLDGHPRTGPIMPVLSHLDAAAPCGLARLESAELGEDYQNNLVACLFNMRMITRHVLTPAGATFESRHESFLVSDNLDFHPTDVLEDADGSLIVIDTGGWYKLCCPTAQLAKPDVLGAIYRVRRTGSHNVKNARGQEIDWKGTTVEKLTGLLTDSRHVVRKRAQQELGRRGPSAIAALDDVLKTYYSEPQCTHAVWALTLIDHPRSFEAVRRALHHADETVRQAALHSISVRRDRDAEAEVAAIVVSGTPHNRRAAAEALGRLGSAESVPALLVATADVTDRVLEHSLIYALIEIGDAEATRQGLAESNVQVQRAAMIALDQMPGGALQLAEVRPLLESPDASLSETAWWVAEHHPEWATELASDFRRAVAMHAVDPAAQPQLSDRLARFAQDASIQQMMAEQLADAGLARQTRIAILDAMISSRMKTMPETWSQPLCNVLSADDEAVLDAGIRAVQSLTDSKPSGPLAVRLQELAHNDRLPVTVRLQALAALPASDRDINAETMEFLCARLNVDEPVQIRALVVDVLAGTTLNLEQLLRVSDTVETTGVMELQRLMEVFVKSQDEQLGRRLVESLGRSPVVGSLSLDRLKALLTGYGPAVLEAGQPLLARIEQENRDKTEQLQTILALVAAGDIRRGQQVFHSTKAACAACHAMGYLGGRIGPDMTRIGRIRGEQDLLESILFPNLSFVRSYEPTTIVTVDGKIVSGVIRNETSSEVTLQLDAQKVVHVAVEDIDERMPGTVSIMPAGLEKQLSPQQLADLVAFLKAAQ